MKIAIAIVPVACALSMGTLWAQLPGQDLHLSYRSSVDGATQPYRVYVPSAYDGKRPVPLVLVLHGTGRNENTMFDATPYGKGYIQSIAEKHGVLLVSPLGRGTTEYRGIGENDIFCVIADVKKQFRIDENRIYTTGLSMGGTGSAYLALHHPDVFAAATAFSPAYSFPWLLENSRDVPIWWIQGATDEKFYHLGIQAGLERMQRLGLTMKYTDIPGEGHDGTLKLFDNALVWMLQHERTAAPAEYTFVAGTPLHGRAYRTSIERMREPGKIASLRVKSGADNVVRIETENVADFSVAPPRGLFDLRNPVRVVADGREVFRRWIRWNQELHLEWRAGRWKPDLRPRQAPDLTAYRVNPVAKATAEVTMNGLEAPMANWITDAMREATGADLALYNRYAYRGLPIPAGTVDIVDLIQASRPFDQYLVTTQLTGRDVLAILDANAAKGDEKQVAQISGGAYVFDPSRAAGKRIVSSTIDPQRTYTVVFEGQVVERNSIDLAGRFQKLPFRRTRVPFTLALYGRAAKHGIIEAKIEGRVRMITKP